MKKPEDEPMHKLLKEALPSMAAKPLGRDLWPAMQARMRAQPVRLSRLDLALACGTAAFALLFPPVIPVLLYCL